MRQLLTTNFILTLVAIPFFFLPPPYIDWFWWINHAAPSKYEFPRLKLFTYEASYYSLIYAPVFFYYGLKLLTNQIQNHKMQMVVVVFLPLLLSLSFGVLGASVLTILLITLSRWQRIIRKKRALVVAGLLILLIVGLVFAAYYFPNNYLTRRLVSILDGNDSSARGRTSDSFQIAWMLASKNNVWFGCGLGQVKILIDDLVREHLGYWGSYSRYDIPNAMGETLAIFGISGVLLRLALQVFLFFKTKVASNQYRLALFIFIFIYQFTGSYITNIAEYTIWAIAFSSAFQQFNLPTET